MVLNLNKIIKKRIIKEYISSFIILFRFEIAKNSRRKLENVIIYRDNKYNNNNKKTFIYINFLLNVLKKYERF